MLMVGCISSDRVTEDAMEQPEYLSKSDFLLNTVVTITIYDHQEETLIDACFDLISKYEAIYSRTNESSELYALNHRTTPLVSEKKLGSTYAVSNELADILRYAYHYSQLSAGAFDLTVAPITSLWDFQTSNPVLPKQADLRNALSQVDYKKIMLNKNEITLLTNGIQIELGSIAKGYIADRVKEYLIEHGVGSAIINLGGNILCIGAKPDGTPFHIGIQEPYADRNETIAIMNITDLSVVSSGVYERFFELNGVLYHHILNPITGYPYDNDLISVTIISEQSKDGDGLSTCCFALGLEQGLQLIESLPNTYAIFITKDYELHYSKDFEHAIEISQ